MQCGLSSRVLDVLRKGGFERPLAIQAQALPGGAAMLGQLCGAGAMFSKAWGCVAECSSVHCF